PDCRRTRRRQIPRQAGRLRFPQAATAATVRRVELTGQGAMTGQAKILAVDDEPDFEALLKQRFRRQIRSSEYAFRFARHGQEAPAVLAEAPEIELLLLDINMPVMDGLTLLSVLQRRQIPVRAIIVSAYGDMANIRTAMNRGAFDFVTKPVDLNDLE